MAITMTTKLKPKRPKKATVYLPIKLQPTQQMMSRAKARERGKAKERAATLLAGKRILNSRNT